MRYKEIWDFSLADRGASCIADSHEWEMNMGRVRGAASRVETFNT
jgi:hypothetical protein